MYDFTNMDTEAQRGRFITFEGLDGCGKTTQLQKLAEVLKKNGLSVITTREPGGTTVGEKIRAVLLDSRTANLNPLTELALMFASRAQQAQEVILPALNSGTWVLCDRFTDSSEAYQGGGRQLGSEPILELHHLLCGGLQPDLTILMITDPSDSVGRARIRNNRKKQASSDEARFELESNAFFDRVKAAYMAIAAREPQRVIKIEASRSIIEVHQEILDTLRARWPAPSPV